MCKIEIEISSIQLLTGSGADEIIISAANFQNGSYPFDGEQEIEMRVGAGKGKLWIEKNLGEDILAVTRIINT